jgi:catechol 2,3-dioxygenase-like lactoylglutathione lyase family enzyme
MSWKIHHTNLPAYDLAASLEFYRSVLGMETSAPDFRPGHRSAAGGIGWFETDGSSQLHLSTPRANYASSAGFFLDPILHGHTAITVPDLETVKHALQQRGVYYADPGGSWAINNMLQIYTYDPSMNVLEINQRVD